MKPFEEQMRSKAQTLREETFDTVIRVIELKDALRIMRRYGKACALESYRRACESMHALYDGRTYDLSQEIIKKTMQSMRGTKRAAKGTEDGR